MHPVVWGAAAAGALGALGALMPGSPPPRPAGGESPTSALQEDAELRRPVGALTTAPRCRRGSLPDWNVAEGIASCVPLPGEDEAIRGARSRRLARGGERPVRLSTSERERRIPRLPNRPATYRSYELPVDPLGPVVEAAPTMEELGVLDDAPPEPTWAGQVPVGVRIDTEQEAPVRVATLDAQEGPAQVLLVGDLYGVTVTTLHRVKTAAGTRDYVVFYGHLDRPGPEIVNGADLAPVAVVGYAGDDRGRDVPHVYLEIRQLRHNADANPPYLSDLAATATSIPTDPRNVLRLR